MMRQFKQFAPAAAAVLVLAAVAGANLLRPTPADAKPYHRHIREVAAQFPRRIGDWVGADAKVPEAAVRLLKPNKIVSRRFTNVTTGETCQFLFVQTKDARDMIGHYPPNCYPRSGWTSRGSEPKVWHVGGLAIAGTAYRFDFDQANADDQQVVDNFIILPDGRFVRSMNKVIDASADYTRHFFGAAQVQLLTRAGMSEARRKRIFHKIMGAAMPMIQAVRSGVKAENQG